MRAFFYLALTNIAVIAVLTVIDRAIFEEAMKKR